MSNAERLRKAAEEFAEALAARREELDEEIAEADRAASAQARRIEELQGEIAVLEATTIPNLRHELDSLPVQVTRASLREEYEEEDQLRARYPEAEKELREAQERSKELRAELNRLMPHTHPQGSHPLDPIIASWGQEVRAAHRASQELTGIEKKVSRAIEEHVRPVERHFLKGRDQMEDWGRRRDYDLSPGNPNRKAGTRSA